jgi:PPE-repeat protein
VATSSAAAPKAGAFAETAVKAAASASVFVVHAAAGAAPIAKTTPPQPQHLGTLLTQLNKHLNDSGKPDQYRVDPQSSTTIQEINPANGAVIGEFSASEFPALARSAGASATGLLVDSLA